MYTVGNGQAHAQDLGDAGSCVKSFRYYFLSIFFMILGLRSFEGTVNYLTCF